LVGECDDARAAAQFVCERTGLATVTLAGYSFGAVVALRAGYDDALVEQLIAIAPPLSMFDVDFLRECTKPKLMLVGEQDQYCPLGVFDRSVATLAEPASCVRLAGADHFLMGQEEELAAHVARFVSCACSDDFGD
jgi:alpha/beta superfamily hydrolase